MQLNWLERHADAVKVYEFESHLDYMNEEEVICPNCGEKENFHFNYNYTKKDLPIEEVLCNECGSFFEIK